MPLETFASMEKQGPLAPARLDLPQCCVAMNRSLARVLWEGLVVERVPSERFGSMEKLGPLVAVLL